MISSLLVSLTGFTSVTPTRAATLTVTDCSASSGAAGRLVEVIAAAAAGDTVNFACSGTITLSATIVINKNLTMDGAGQTLVISGDATVRVFTINAGVTATLRYLTIANGYDSGINNSGSLTVANSIVVGNYANASGGGGISNTGSLTVTHSTITGNYANAGAGISNNAGTLSVANSTISDNTAFGEGGGIHNWLGTLTVANSTISDNTASSSGGGIYSYGTMTAANSTISGNTANSPGGGIYNTTGSVLTMTSITLIGNAANYGGGIYNMGTLTVANSTLSGGSALYGGGIFNDGSLTLLNSTLSGNTADYEGGGIYNEMHGALNYANTIIANSPNGGECDNVGTGIIGTNIKNLVEDGTCGASISGDPLLSALADNGGPTLTFALLPGSPARDAGDDTVCAAAPVSGLDQRGVTRPFGAHCDIGAYESLAQHGPSFVVNDSSDADDGSCESKPGGNCTLREALNAANTYAGPNTIGFDAALSGQTILLGDTLTLASEVTIDGTGVGITISGGDAVRVFIVSGGGIAELRGLTITHGNASGTHYGGGISNAGVLTVVNSTLLENAASYGGGIFNAGALTVTNSTISGGSTLYGGGIFNDGLLNLRNSTLSGNSASNNGGGIYNETHGTLNYANTIIANSLAGGDCINWGAGIIGTNTHNLVEDGTCSPALSGDPLLGAFGGYGGATQTFPLLPGSPALDAGSACQPADQRGQPRSAPNCDIGAFESQGFTLLISEGNNQPAMLNAGFAYPLTVMVTPLNAGEPVEGGRVIFTAPLSGASATISGSPATISGSAASVTATANNIIGAYPITASITGSSPVNFNLRNIDDDAPVGLTLSNQSIPENLPAGSLVSILITDPYVGYTLTYTLAAGPGDTDNASFSISGDRLLITHSFNFEIKSSYSVRIRTTNRAGLWYEKAFTITVTNVNEAPIVLLTNTITSLPENTFTGSAIKVADIHVKDDALGTYVLSLSGADAALFEIVGSALYLKAGTKLNFETNPTLNVTVEVDDNTVGSSPDDVEALAISITDVQEFYIYLPVVVRSSGTR